MMLDTQEIEMQLHEAARKLEAAAGQIRKARMAAQGQDTLLRQIVMVGEATATLVGATQRLHVVIEALEDRTRYLEEN
jgi:hypothetical protein